jgi:drug/metabolite transporter (DMT)-like permease
MPRVSAKPKAVTLVAVLLLVGVTAVWGWTFLSVKNAVLAMPVMDFLAIRFSIAAALLVVLRPRAIRRINGQQLRHGVVLGLLLGSSYIAQTFGLRITSPATAGFITGMGVVITPVAAWLAFKDRIGLRTWAGVILATIGLALLSLHGWRFGAGELLVLLCACCVAGHIIGLGRWSPLHDTYNLALVQITIVALLSLAVALPGGITLPPDGTTWSTVLITAVLATSLAFIVQTWVQRLISATQAAVILTMEPVFAGLFAVLLGGEVMTVKGLAGGICIVAAMLIVQLAARAKPLTLLEP